MKTYHSEIAESIGSLPQNTKFTCRSAYEKTGDELFKRRGVMNRIKDYSKTTVIKNGVKVHYGGKEEVTYMRGTKTIRRMASTFMWTKYKYSRNSVGGRVNDSSII